MSIHWNEIKSRALLFSQTWADACNEKSQSAPFWIAFFEIFGITDKRVGTFERNVQKLGGATGFIDLFWPGKLLVEQKSLGKDLNNATQQAMDYPLPIFSVESLIYSQEAQDAVAKQQAETFGIEFHELLNVAKNMAIESLKGQGKKKHLVSRLAERQVRDRLLSEAPTRQQLMSENSCDLKVVIKSPYPDALARLKTLVDLYDIHEIVSRYPVRESGVLDGIAKGLRFNNRDDYERSMLQRVSVDADLRAALKQKLGKLAAQLE
jgi:hypothetical protein